MRIIIAFLSVFASTALYAITPALHIEASYEVSTKGIKIAIIKESFARSGDHYRIESITRPVGLLALFKPDTLDVISEGDFTSQGLRPHNFTYKRSLDTNKNATASFDWKQSGLALDDSDGRRVVALPADTQDRLSALYQFRFLPSVQGRKELIMHITDGRKLDTRHYLIHTGNSLTTPLGTLKTLYLSTPPEETAWKSEIWLSVEKGNFPCKIVVTEDNGDQLTQTLTALSISQ